MARKSKAEAYKDVKELNWEETGPAPAEDQGIEGVPASWGVLERLALHLDQVDPELRQNNPVWHWALCDDHTTFIFRDGRKVTINF